MRSRWQPIRIWCNAAILLFGALLSHAVAGGSFVTAARLSIELALTIPVLLILSNRLIEGPKLALLVLFAQSNGHILLGASSINNLGMLLSHLIGGITSYLLITKFEAIWVTSMRFVEILVIPIRLFKINLFTIFNLVCAVETSLFQNFHKLDSLNRRGPPLLSIGINS